MKISIKRVYDAAERKDGFRVLVDRLWPRGVSKDAAAADYWARDFAPSATLREWFHANTEERFSVFAKRYQEELNKHNGLSVLKKALKGNPRITLLTSSKDPARSHAAVLKKLLERE